MTDVTIGGDTFNVLVEGDETLPVLMLSNSLGTNLHLWDAQMPAFLKHFRTVRYDSRGHGGSTADPGPYSMAQLGRDALAILDALAIDRVHWLGISKGGAVGQWLMIHAPHRIERAVLANTAARFGNPAVWNQRILAVRDGGMPCITDSVMARWFSPEFLAAAPERVELVRAALLDTPAEGYASCCAALRDLDLRDAVRGIEHAVLVVAGRDDPSVVTAQTDFLAGAIPDAKLVTLATRHISNIEDTPGFTKAVIDFLTAKPRARRRPARKTTLPPPFPLPSGRRPAGRRAATVRGAVSEKLTRRAPAPAAAAPDPANRTKAVKTAKTGKASKAPAPKALKALAPPAKAAAPKPVLGKAPAPKAGKTKASVKPMPSVKSPKTAIRAAAKPPAKKAPAAKAAAPKSAPVRAAEANAAKAKAASPAKAAASPAKAPRAAKTQARPIGTKPAAKAQATKAGASSPAKGRAPKPAAPKSAPAKSSAAKPPAKAAPVKTAPAKPPAMRKAAPKTSGRRVR